MTATRFVGLDVHKRQITVAAVNAQQEVVLSPHKVSVAGFTAWAKAHLQASDQVALEATSNAWEFHDQLLAQVAAVSVANSQQIKLISASARKTDKQDALVLAKLLAAHLPAHRLGTTASGARSAQFDPTPIPAHPSTRCAQEPVARYPPPPQCDVASRQSFYGSL